MKIDFVPDSSSSGVGFSKCLLLGGYVVLDQRYSGICIDLDPKIRCTTKVTNTNCSTITAKILSQTTEQDGSHRIKIDSTYNQSEWDNPDVFKSKFEKFVFSSLYVFFNFFKASTPIFLNIEITADPQFYTDKGKTGLGSSSATVVAVLMSLLKHTKPESERETLTDDDKELLFKLASVSHSIAQGKVGSCFDISTAIWGAQVYKRPHSIDITRIESISEHWDNHHSPLNFPKSTKLWLINTGLDGSSTADLVRGFNKEKVSREEDFNELVASITAAEHVIQSEENENIKGAFERVKAIQKKITKDWKVPILPDEVQSLIKSIEQLPGVITAIPPGAGGYDAIAVLTHSEVESIASYSVLATKTFI